MVNYNESWDVLKDERLKIKCRCKLCGTEFVADFIENMNIKLHFHPKTSQDCWMPQCPNGCSQTIN